MRKPLLGWLFLFVSWLLALPVAIPASAQSNYSLKPGDRVVFYGDSITDQRLYTNFVEAYTITRFPQLNVTFIHSGWGGDRVTGGGGGPIDTRLERDVIAYKPTVVTIMLGMNDGEYRAFDQGVFEVYANGYRHIVETLTKALPQVRLTLIEPSPFDDVTRPPTFEGGYNAVLRRYGQFVKRLAQEQHFTVTDANAPIVEALVQAMRVNPDLARQIIPDRVHPAPGGHLILAEAILKSWHAPSTVTAVEIDAAAKKVNAARKTTIKNLKFGSDISWTETDKSLPMPLHLKDPVEALALRVSDFVQTLDEEPLKVTGLDQQQYDLKIDGKDVGKFTKEELAQGVNLALLPTPMLDQANEVYDLTVMHNSIHYSRWRDIQVPLHDKRLKEVSDAEQALDKLERKVVQLQRDAALPKTHHYELLPL
ncbi:MAG TPA: SGNH/GDSL hydrolase family protein [Terriglobia bacterium]|nr:SGNH/GDSL hydrolase family protein [Terriglobia bacterium]